MLKFDAGINSGLGNRKVKGEVRRFFLSAQSFYWPQTKRSLNRQFSPKSPKVGKNRVTLAVKLEINGFQPICLPLCGGRSFSPLSAQLFCPAGSEAGIRG